MPLPSHLWQGKELRAIICHTGRIARQGHWVTFVQSGELWWKEDSSLQNPVMEDPFLHQFNNDAGGVHTLDILFLHSSSSEQFEEIDPEKIIHRATK